MKELTERLGQIRESKNESIKLQEYEKAYNFRVEERKLLIQIYDIDPTNPLVANDSYIKNIKDR